MSVNRDRWLSIAEHSPQATFFHTPHWSDIALAADPGLESATFEMELPDGAPAVWPLVRRRSRRGTVASTFAGCYGGPIASRALETSDMPGLYRALLRQAEGGVRVVLGPLSPRGEVPRVFEIETDSTLVLDLGSPFEDLLQGFSKGHRRAYHRSAQEGVTVRQADPAADWPAYVAMYQEHLTAFGNRASSSYRREAFERMAGVARDHPDAVALWLAEYDGRPVAGCWGFTWRDRMVLWHGAARTLEQTMISPPTLLYGEIARLAQERGLRILDFNPSGGHAGPEAFKRRFGTVRQPVVRLACSTPSRRPLLRVVRRLTPGTVR